MLINENHELFFINLYRKSFIPDYIMKPDCILVGIFKSMKNPRPNYFYGILKTAENKNNFIFLFFFFIAHILPAKHHCIYLIKTINIVLKT